MRELVLIRGLPGSGKSTIAKVVGGQLCEADQYFARAGGYEFDPSQLPAAHDFCKERAEGFMQDNEPKIVVANTFTRKWEMQPYIDLAARHGYRVHIIVAKGKFRNTHGVPDAAVERMRARWED